MKKMQMWQRQSLLERIQAENERATSMMGQRAALQQQRKEANMQASMQRQALNQMIDSMRCAVGGVVCATAQLGVSLNW